MPAVNIDVEATLSLSAGNRNNVAVEQLDQRDKQPLIQHMPPGDAWRVLARSTVIHSIMCGIATCFGRVGVIERLMIRQADPATATIGLENWENILDIDGVGLTLEERRANIIAALRARGGQSIPYWEQLLEDLGYTNVVTPLENRFRMGDQLRKRLQGNGFAYAFQITMDSQGAAKDAYTKALIEDALRATVYVWIVFV